MRTLRCNRCDVRLEESYRSESIQVLDRATRTEPNGYAEGTVRRAAIVCSAACLVALGEAWAIDDQLNGDASGAPTKEEPF